MRGWGKALLGLAVTAFLLWWVLRGEDLSEVWANIRGGNLWLLAASMTVATAGFAIRAMRWKVLLTPVAPDTAFRPRWIAVCVGFAANNVLPARVGEFARALAYSRMESVSASAAFGTLVVERLLDAVVILGLLVLPALTADFAGSETFSTGFGAALLRLGLLGVMIVLAALVAMVVWPTRFVRMAERGARWLPAGVARRIVDALEAFLDALDVIRSPRLLLAAFLWTVGFWLFHSLGFWLGMLAFGIHEGFVAAVFTNAVTAISVALPAAPGFFGTFHAGAEFALTGVYGVEASRSLAFAFGYHFGGWLPITVIGIWYVWRMGLSWTDVGSSEERVEEEIQREHPSAREPFAGR